MKQPSRRVADAKHQDRSQQRAEGDVGVADAQAEKQLPIPFANVRSAIAPLQHDQRHREHQHGEFQEQADRQGELFAARPLQCGAALKPSADNGAVVAEALRETVDPQEQKIDQRENRSGDDQLLRQKARQRQIAGDRGHDNRADNGPHDRADQFEQPRRRGGARRAQRRAQKRNHEAGHEQTGGKRDRDGQRKWRLDETGGNIKKRGQAIDDGEQRDEIAQPRRRRVGGRNEPPVRRTRRKYRAGQRPDREDNHERLRREIEQPVDTLRQALGAGNHAVQEGKRHDDRKRTENHQCGGRRGAAPERRRVGGVFGAPRAANAAPACGAKQQCQQQGFDRDVANFAPVRNVLPPIRDQVADFARRRGHMLRQVCPRLIGVNAGDRLEQDGRKILAADILNSVQQILDAQIARIDRRLSSGQQA